ncbi:MAG: hypothetical protein JO131_06940 [Gammaproteobacteria bacterium]|nr:hypothetical protein [Gammaproteobacteria bacterium]
MKTFLLFIFSLLVVFILPGSSFAHCQKKVISTVVYGTPITYQVYRACPCSGTWGSPSCNCADTPIRRTSCDSCSVVEHQYNYVPGHMQDGNEVYYADPDVYPSPYAYHEDWAYTVP